MPCQQALRCAKLLAAICTSVIVFILHCYLGRGALPDLIFPLLFFFFLICLCITLYPELQSSPADTGESSTGLKGQEGSGAAFGAEICMLVQRGSAVGVPEALGLPSCLCACGAVQGEP